MKFIKTVYWRLLDCTLGKKKTLYIRLASARLKNFSLALSIEGFRPLSGEYWYRPGIRNQDITLPNTVRLAMFVMELDETYFKRTTWSVLIKKQRLIERTKCARAPATGFCVALTAWYRANTIQGTWPMFSVNKSIQIVKKHADTTFQKFSATALIFLKMYTNGSHF